jgi:hypothetical protein
LGFNKTGQTLLEYSLILSVIVGVFLTMTPLFKRGLQGMIKIAADQVGNQRNGDQVFDENGYLKSSYSGVMSRTQKRTRDYEGEVFYSYNDLVDTDSEVITNLGFTEDQL